MWTTTYCTLRTDCRGLVKSTDHKYIVDPASREPCVERRYPRLARPAVVGADAEPAVSTLLFELFMSCSACW